MRVEQQEQRIIDDTLPTGVDFFNRIPGKPQAQATGVPVLPVSVSHLPSIWTKPGKVLYFRPPDMAALKKFAPAQSWMVMKHTDEVFGKP